MRIFRPSSSDWAELVRMLPEQSVPMSLIRVEPRDRGTSLREEQGPWIESLWRKVSASNPAVVGLRLSWSQVMIFWPGRAGDNVIREMTGLLKDATATGLKSLTLFSAASGGEEALRELQRMELQLAKIGYWKEHIFPSYYQDGEEVPLDAD